MQINEKVKSRLVIVFSVFMILAVGLGAYIGVITAFDREAKARAARGEQITFEINGEAISYKDAAMYGARALASFYARPADQRPEGGRVSDREIVETSLRIFFAEQQQKQVQKLAKAYLPEPIVMPEATPDSAKGSQ